MTRRASPLEGGIHDLGDLVDALEELERREPGWVIDLDEKELSPRAFAAYLLSCCQERDCAIYEDFS